MDMPASSFFIGGTFVAAGTVLVLGPVFRDVTIQKISAATKIVKRILLYGQMRGCNRVQEVYTYVMMASKACFAAIDPPSLEPFLPPFE